MDKPDSKTEVTAANSQLEKAVGSLDGTDIKFPYTLELSSPLENGVTKIVFRKPKGRDWARWNGVENETEKFHGLLADLAETTVETLGDLDMEDHVKAVAVAKAFFEPYQPMEENGFVKLLLTSPSLTDGLMKAATS